VKEETTTVDGRVFAVTGIPHRAFIIQRGGIALLIQFSTNWGLILKQDLIRVLARMVGVATVLNILDSRLKVTLFLLELQLGDNLEELAKKFASLLLTTLIPQTVDLADPVLSSDAFRL